MRYAALCVVGTLVAGTASLQAHHGYAGFFDPQQRTVSIEGDLENITYGNPHVVMTVRTADSTLYTVTWQSAYWVARRAGVTKSTFHAGDHLIIIGAPPRDSAAHEVTRVRELQRPRDGWLWRDRGEFARPSVFK
jgi:hypothetical protein